MKRYCATVKVTRYECYVFSAECMDEAIKEARLIAEGKEDESAYDHVYSELDDLSVCIVDSMDRPYETYEGYADDECPLSVPRYTESSVAPG